MVMVIVLLCFLLRYLSFFLNFGDDDYDGHHACLTHQMIIIFAVRLEPHRITFDIGTFDAAHHNVLPNLSGAATEQDEQALKREDK